MTTFILAIHEEERLCVVAAAEVGDMISLEECEAESWLEAKEKLCPLGSIRFAVAKVRPKKSGLLD